MKPSKQKKTIIPPKPPIKPLPAPYTPPPPLSPAFHPSSSPPPPLSTRPASTMSEANGHDDAAVADLIQRLSLAEGNDRAAAAVDVATHVAGGGIFALQTGGLLAGLTTSLEDSSPAGAREGALLSLIQLSDTLGRAFEPFFLPLLPVILHLLADKALPVRVAAIAAGRALLKTLSPHATAMVLPMLYDGIGGNRKWQTKEGSYTLLRLIQKTSPSQITKALPDLVPNVSGAVTNQGAFRPPFKGSSEIVDQPCAHFQPMSTGTSAESAIKKKSHGFVPCINDSLDKLRCAVASVDIDAAMTCGITAAFQTTKQCLPQSCLLLAGGFSSQKPWKRTDMQQSKCIIRRLVRVCPC